MQRLPIWRQRGKASPALLAGPHVPPLLICKTPLPYPYDEQAEKDLAEWLKSWNEEAKILIVDSHESEISFVPCPPTSIARYVSSL